MIRGIAVFSAILLLLLVFYLPSVFPPERFEMQRLYDQNALSTAWHPQAATRVLLRYRSWKHRQVANALYPADPPAGTAKPSPEVNETLSQIHRRLKASSYFRSFRAMLELAGYRWATMVEWFPLVLAPAVAMLMDGAVARKIRAYQFKAPNPEYLALATCALILTVAVQAGVSIIPLNLSLYLAPSGDLAAFLLLALMLAEYHHPHQ